MVKILYKSKHITITENDVTYYGHTEKITNVKSFNLIRNTVLSKSKNSAYGAIVMVGIAIFLGPILGDYAGVNLNIVRFAIPIFMGITGFLVPFIWIKAFSLEIVKSSGIRGVIAHSNEAHEFEKVIIAFNKIKSNTKE